MKEWEKWDKRLQTLEKKIRTSNKYQQEIAYKAPSSFKVFCGGLTIRSGVSLVPFDLYDYQEATSGIIDVTRKTQIIKCRQLGISEMMLAKLGHKAIPDPAFLATVFAQNQSDTSEFALRLSDMTYILQRQGLTMASDNKLEFSPRGGGRVLFRNSSTENPRSIPSVTYNVFDEAAFPPKIDLLYAASIPAQSMVGDAARTIIISTPNGTGNWFYDQMIEGNDVDILEIIEDIRAQKLPPFYVIYSRDRKSAKVIIHWRAHPIYGQQEDYLERVQAETNLPWDKVLQEYDLDFTQSEEILFPPHILVGCEQEEELTTLLYDGFYLGVDVATTGKDYTVATILGEYQGRLYEVDQYRERKRTKEYDIAHISQLIRQWAPNKVLVEKNHAGSVYLEELAIAHPDVDIEGITTSKPAKEAYIGRLQLYCERGAARMAKTTQSFYEISIFRRFPDGTMGAPSGKNDDCVISWALGVLAYGAPPPKDVIQLNLRR